MRKWLLAVIVVCICLVVGAQINLSSLAQSSSPPPDEPKPRKVFKVLSRGADFEVVNSSTPHAPAHVVGKGEFPIRLNVIEQGEWPHTRRLQVMVAVYTRPNPRSLKPGELILAETDPRILTTEAGEEGEASFELDIPLLPGDYVAYIILCDPDRPYQETIIRRHAFPDPEQFPGALLQVKAMSVQVEPAE